MKYACWNMFLKNLHIPNVWSSSLSCRLLFVFISSSSFSTSSCEGAGDGDIVIFWFCCGSCGSGVSAGNGIVWDWICAGSIIISFVALSVLIDIMSVLISGCWNVVWAMNKHFRKCYVEVEPVRNGAKLCVEIEVKFWRH